MPYFHVETEPLLHLAQDWRTGLLQSKWVQDGPRHDKHFCIPLSPRTVHLTQTGWQPYSHMCPLGHNRPTRLPG